LTTHYPSHWEVRRFWIGSAEGANANINAMLRPKELDAVERDVPHWNEYQVYGISPLQRSVTTKITQMTHTNPFHHRDITEILKRDQCV
jgi:hypothetical protein